MANEISLLCDLSLTKGLNKHVCQPGLIRITQTGVGHFDQVYDIGTTEESIGTFGDITTEGVMYVYNLDTTNYVQLGFSTGVYGGRLRPLGIPYVAPAEPNVTLYLKANTAACKVRVVCYEL